MKKAYLVLENGQIFEGLAFGAEIETVGELVFNTMAAGYTETFTDPAYCGQIVLQTFPMVGNYGIIPEDFNGECVMKGLVVREWCEIPSNFRSQGTVDQFLKENNIPGIYGVDTRQITKLLRENGVMNAAICYEMPKNFDSIRAYRVENAVAEVTNADEKMYGADGAATYHVAVLNYGVRKSTIDAFRKAGCCVTVLPADSTAEQVLEIGADGLYLSEGPGDPAENTEAINVVRTLLGKMPIFAVGLGHQILALANGGMTYKLKYGHRGGNMPVKEVNGERTYITGQNHGYAVASNSVANGAVSYVNVNDGSCEGIAYSDANAFSVQFYPDSCMGMFDKLFAQFAKMMGGNEDAAE